MKDSEGKVSNKGLILALIAIALMVMTISGYAVYWMTGKVTHGLGGEVFPKPVVQRASEEAPKEASVVETVKIDRQKSVVIVKVPMPVKEEPPPDETARAAWGQLGDYFGGTLNPIFGFISLLLLLGTFCFQIWELTLTRRELELTTDAQRKSAEALKKQSFEQTFFAWLGMYREVLANVRCSAYGGKVLEGKAALKDLYESNLCYNYIFDMAQRTTHHLRNDSDSKVTGERLSLLSDRQWKDLYRRYEGDLGSLFRVLYRLLKWIDEQDMVVEDKWLYVRIIRSQLSWIEMFYLFYNGMTERGAKFKDLIEQYALFDNFTLSNDRILEVLCKDPMWGQPYSASAFNSDEARKMCFTENDSDD